MNHHHHDYIHTDAVIIGAGPSGLSAIFQLGIHEISVHVIDILNRPGGQLTELYPEKPIYDIPGFASITAQGLVDNLVSQITPFNPVFHFESLVSRIKRQHDGSFIVGTDHGKEFKTRLVVIAAGGGSFQPRRPPVPEIETYEGKSVFYAVRRKEAFAGHKVLVVGGGDSALDWAINLQPIAEKVTLLHRRNEFRGSARSVEKMRAMVAEGKIELVIGQVTHLKGEDGFLTGTEVKGNKGEVYDIETTRMIPFFGLASSLGPVAHWGLNLESNQILIDPATCQTNEPGIFAIGDICSYPGKLKLILAGFYEGAIMAHAAKAHLAPGEDTFVMHSSSSKELQKRLGFG